MNIIYKEADKDDAYGINYVAAYSWKETYSELLPKEYLDNRINNIENKVESTQKFLANNQGKYIVAKDNDKVVGILSYGSSKEGYDGYGHLGAIYVLKDYQGLGIGKELFRIAVQGLINMGYSKMQFECMSGNKTSDFYKKYTGEFFKTVDFPIKNVGLVKAEVFLFNDLNKVIDILNKSGEYNHSFANTSAISINNLKRL